MKLATYHDGSRDGQLIVVSRDLRSAHCASGAASRLQQVLDDWNFMSPQLEEISRTLNQGKARHAFAFEPQKCMAPLPRAYQLAVGSAYLNHVELAHKALGADMPESFRAAPQMYRAGSDAFLGPRDAIPWAGTEHGTPHGIDFGAELAAVTDDVPMGTTPQAAVQHVRLLMLSNAVYQRALTPADLPGNPGLVQGRPATAFSPVAVTPDELGESWHGGRLHLNLESNWNGKRVGLCNAGAEMTFHFGQLIAHLCETRNVRAGSVVGTGPISNRDGTLGYSCIADKRASEIIARGSPKTLFMQLGDTIRIEMKGSDGSSLFGAIEQKVVSLTQPERGLAQLSLAGLGS